MDDNYESVRIFYMNEGLYFLSDVCYGCCQDGTLILCDTCPLAFHPECVALRKVPRGAWSCPECTGETGENANHPVTDINVSS